MIKKIISQFFDQRTVYGLGGLALLHGIAWLVQHSWWSAVPIVVIGVVVMIVACRSLVWGMALAMLEVFIGGHGHLIDISVGGMTVGLRLTMFVAVMFGALYHIFFRKIFPRWMFERDAPIVTLLGVVTVSFAIGFLRNGFAFTFDDANGYMTLLYIIPIAMVTWTAEAKRIFLWTLGLGGAWIALSSLILLFCFTHLPVEGIWALYGFVRDARLAEVTLLSGPLWLVRLFPNGPWYFRVFEQSQFAVMILTLVLVSGVAWVVKEKGVGSRGEGVGSRQWALGRVMGLLALLFAVDISSQSRSFWLGLIAGGSVLALALVRDWVKVKEVMMMKILGVGSLLLALTMLWTIIVFPFPSRPDLTHSPYYKGTTDDTRDLAVSSRWNLLPPMMAAIAEHPVVGSGFGKTVTYISDDPRIRAMNGTGEWTTYRFEWGYQDIWLKMGLPGLVVFLWYLVNILRAGYRSLVAREETRWLTVGLTCGIVALYVTHIFSPYLNHPIGLGFMVFVLPFFSWRNSAFFMKEQNITPVTKTRILPLSSPISAMKTRENSIMLQK